MGATFKVLDDNEVRNVFEKHTNYQVFGTLSAPSLNAALCELGITEDPGAQSEVDFDAFKRIARRPTEVELWIQSQLPLAALLAMCLSTRQTTLTEFANSNDDDLNRGLQKFQFAVSKLVRGKIKILKAECDDGSGPKESVINDAVQFKVCLTTQDEWSIAFLLDSKPGINSR